MPPGGVFRRREGRQLPISTLFLFLYLAGRQGESMRNKYSKYIHLDGPYFICHQSEGFAPVLISKSRRLCILCMFCNIPTSI